MERIVRKYFLYCDIKLLINTLKSFISANNTDSTSLYQANVETYSYEICAQSYTKETEEQLRREQICALGPPPMYADACEVG